MTYIVQLQRQTDTQRNICAKKLSKKTELKKSEELSTQPD